MTLTIEAQHWSAASADTQAHPHNINIATGLDHSHRATTRNLCWTTQFTTTEGQDVNLLLHSYALERNTSVLIPETIASFPVHSQILPHAQLWRKIGYEIKSGGNKANLR